MNTNGGGGDRQKGTTSITARIPWPAVLSIAVVSTTGLVTYRMLSRYGLEGSFWLIWEGSPYHPRIRAKAEALDSAESTLKEKERVIVALEIGLERAIEHDTAVGGQPPEQLLQHWKSQLNPPISDIRLYLAQLSDDLDKVAGKIDAVNSADETDIKTRKKRLSKQVVKFMERSDRMIQFYSHNFE